MTGTAHAGAEALLARGPFEAMVCAEEHRDRVEILLIQRRSAFGPHPIALVEIENPALDFAARKALATNIARRLNRDGETLAEAKAPFLRVPAVGDVAQSSAESFRRSTSCEAEEKIR